VKLKKPQGPRRRTWVLLGGVVVVLLAAMVFTLGSLNVPLGPERGNEFSVFFAVSTLIVVALLVFSLILSRSLIRIWAERRSRQLGSRFKVKMVLGAMSISLLPIIFLFFVSYALVNRTLNAWFPRPLELANEQTQQQMEDMARSSREHLNRIAQRAAASADVGETLRGLDWAIDASWHTNSAGVTTDGESYSAPAAATRAGGHTDVLTTPTAPTKLAPPPVFVRALPSSAEIWRASGQLYVAGSAPTKSGRLYVGRMLPNDFLEHYNDIETQTKTYLQQKQNLRAYKRSILLALFFVTVLLVFATTWVALFLSKQVTVPIQALAEATREIARGNFDHQIDVHAQDELGTLVRSFNRMTEQLGEGRRQINEFTLSLEHAIEEREGRRKLMEAILENIPTGVVSLTATGEIARLNSAIPAILGEHAKSARTLQELLGEDGARGVMHLMRRSLRMGAASREIEVAAKGRLVRAAVTVSSLGPRKSNPGFVVVIDDLTDLLRAQKAAAWQEVAQRIAHEIKNPLTPIQLSAQRLLRHLDRHSSGQTNGVKVAGANGNGSSGGDLEKLVADCAGLIEREVHTLESLVDAFSQFARFPSARLSAEDLNTIVASAVELFHGRLEGIALKTELAATLPPVRADRELLRRVVANLIDNAAESMEGSTIRRLRVATRVDAERETVEIEVADSGHGISPEDKEKLFLPHFSTKDRGTGLGLAIASRIIAEHNGTIHVEDNLPTGTKFIIRFPVAEVAAATPAVET
jgi:two-component system, NtrC family, nitrogen regulation sensor histidine kinase NtrY